MNTEQMKANAYLEAGADAFIAGKNFNEGHNAGVAAIAKIESATPILDDIVASVAELPFELVRYSMQRDFNEEKYGTTSHYLSRDVAESDYNTMVRHGYGVKMYFHGEFVKESSPK